MTDSEMRMMIWSDIYADCEEYMNAVNEGLEDDEKYDVNDYEMFNELLMADLETDRMNLAIPLNQPVLVCADFGLWDGRRSGYKIIKAHTIGDLLSCADNCEYHTFYINEFDNLACNAVHHDGTNYLVYRIFKPEVDEEMICDIEDAICDGKKTVGDLLAMTKPLGPNVRAVYGWDKVERE